MRTQKRNFCSVLPNTSLNFFYLYLHRWMKIYLHLFEVNKFVITTFDVINYILTERYIIRGKNPPLLMWIDYVWKGTVLFHQSQHITYKIHKTEVVIFFGKFKIIHIFENVEYSLFPWSFFWINKLYWGRLELLVCGGRSVSSA